VLPPVDRLHSTSEENEMTSLTDRVTVEERAAAWDYLMSSTEPESVAISKAWCWLRDQAAAPEAAELVAKDEGLTLEAENVVPLPVVRD
jgi:hypothetical protein